MTRKFSVLVVDDEPPLRKVLRTTLTARGFTIEGAGTAERALDLARQRHFDLILLDISMPGMGGIEACRRFHALSSNVGIVMVTVREAEENMIEALEAGAYDYITKPFRFGELVARLRAVLRRAGPDYACAPVLQGGDLEIAFDRRSATPFGHEIHLTPTEFDLLALLMRNQGSLLPHAKLLGTIWGRIMGMN